METEATVRIGSGPGVASGREVGNAVPAVTQTQKQQAALRTGSILGNLSVHFPHQDGGERKMSLPGDLKDNQETADFLPLGSFRSYSLAWLGNSPLKPQGKASPPKAIFDSLIP